jgi:hypothetical protein
MRANYYAPGRPGGDTGFAGWIAGIGPATGTRREDDDMTVDELIARARLTLGKSIPYRLGAYTGLAFDSPTPPVAGLDCSTFVRWAANLDLPKNGRWDTTGIVMEALRTGTDKYFEVLQGPQRGCLIVYPDYSWKPDLPAGLMAAYAAKAGPIDGKNDGHIGIVTRTVQKGGKEVVASVIHCSRLNEAYREAMIPQSQDGSVLESGPLWFPSYSPVYVWIKGLVS